MFKKTDRVVTPDGLGHIVHDFGTDPHSDLQIHQFAVKRLDGKTAAYRVDELRPATSKDFKKGRAEIYKRQDKKWDYRIIQKNGQLLASSKQGYVNRLDMLKVLNNNFIQFEVIDLSKKEEAK